MKKLAKGLLKLAGEILVMTAVLLCLNIAIDGMYLLGLPKAENIRSVELSYSERTAETKHLTDAEDIETALNLTGFLKYKVFAKAEENGKPIVTMTFSLQDGTALTLAANETTLCWKDRTYALKHPKTFLNLTEGIYFLPETQAMTQE